ncbi:MAG TPA: insulinase family protein [Synechococcales cyanobacterium M55_K2018_004]|nr:insulinase family protein [Synechococcales cyanobacterium M55_K2018_004]
MVSSRWFVALGDRSPQEQRRVLGGVRRSLLMLMAIALLCLGIPQSSWADATAQPAINIQPYIDRVVNNITEFTLDNGMKFIVLKRDKAPVISFMTYVDVGSAYEAEGKTGAAHFLEHLAFKGTTRIGTTNYRAERPLLNRLDRLFDQIQAAKAAGKPDAEIKSLQEQFETLRKQAASYVRQNEYGQIVERAGGVGLNATTSADETRYFYSFPANKLELWMSLESERFLEPVFREFFEEKDVILEERRLRTDNSPIGKMIEEFLKTAFPGHPYGRPIIGYEEDIRNLTRQDIQDFYDKYYTPNHIISVIVGDVDPAQVKELAHVYFGRYKAQSQAPDVQATAPVQTAPREVTLRLPTQPWYLEGYQRPSVRDRDHVVYDMISSILSGGRTSRLYRALVEQKLTLNIAVMNSFPGDRYPTMMLLYALTAPGHTPEEVAAVIGRELERLKREPVSAEELDRVKTQTRAGLLRLLASNEGMTDLLSEYEAKTGSWRNLFEELKAIEAVTAADVQRVARATFVPEKMTIGKLLPPEASQS